MGFDVDKLLEQIKETVLLTERQFYQLCEQIKDILCEESNVCPVSAPVTVCGDMHGQFFDLLELFSRGGELPSQNYLFLGDYVDRGMHSVEVLTLLLLLKCKYPGNITILRGNHETRGITQAYGFYEECERKYGNQNVWNYCVDLFDHLPPCATIEGKIVCMHGGLSPDCKTLDQVRVLNRVQEIPMEGLLCDIAWSDPDHVQNFKASGRGAGYLFGENITKQFCQMNGLDCILRAHQIAMDGYAEWFQEKLFTIWSCPNYQYRCGNRATILQLDEKLNREWIKIPSAEKSQDCEMWTAKSKKNVLPYFL